MRKINSKNQYVFDFNGVKDIRENSEKYFEVMRDLGIICFRGAFLDLEKSMDVLSELSRGFNWTPGYVAQDGRKVDWRYTQNYDDRASAFDVDNIEQGLINPWHLEGMYKKHTMHAVGWSMRNFKCDSSVGQTGFVDASVLVETMPIEMYEFMKRSRLIHYPIFAKKFPDDYKAMLLNFSLGVGKMDEKIWTIDGDSEVSSNAHDAIQNHPTFGYEVLRLCPCCERWGHQHLLFSVDGKKPTNDQNQMFEEVREWLRNQLLDESMVWYHEYEEGDFVVPDLFIMIHSAKGGFSPGEREFDGFWCFQKNVDYKENLVREFS
jgi:hypothetical protein